MRRPRTVALAAASAATTLVALLGVTATPAAAGELLVNGGLESGSLSPWSCTGGLGSVVNTPIHSGTRALAGAANSSDNARCTQTVTVVPNTTASCGTNATRARTAAGSASARRTPSKLTVPDIGS